MDTKHMELENRLRAVSDKSDHFEIRRIMRRQRAGLSVLRAQFTQLRDMEEAEHHWQQWLLDNFYALEGHAKQCLLDLRHFKSSSKKCAVLYRYFDAAFTAGDADADDDTLKFVLESAAAHTDLCERQLDFIPVALKCALLTVAYNACEQSLTEEEREQMISRAVRSLDLMSEINFDKLTTQCSPVELIFFADPAGVYPKMVAQSRKHYRQVTARIAKRSGLSEAQVARDVLEHAQKAQEERARHIGYHLLGNDPLKKSARRRGILVLWVSLLIPVILCALAWLLAGPVAVLLYLPLFEIVRLIASKLAHHKVPAYHIPRMQLNGNTPKTVVAISTLLPNAQQVPQLRERLEQLYFSNKHKNLYFCVLADFKEDKHPYNAQDDVNVAAVRKLIERLNLQYGERFMMFVRRRTFSKTQNAYCGWERKRGAITEFIRYCGGGETTVHCFAGDKTVLSQLRYLIALDADTNLSFDSANQLISAAVHPLNRPVIDERGVVSEGFGILVPRIGVDLECARQTDFTRIMAGAGGVSTYEQECGDFYQDLFGQAIFAGKGLIDMEAFQKVVGWRFPENIVLSHDILEGAYLRAGLLSDVEMTEGSPQSTISWFARLHRWMRGDWQNILFLKKSYQVAAVTRENPLGRLGRIQLLDNLRRSLTAPAALLCVITAAFLSPLEAFLFCLVAFLSTAGGPFFAAAGALVAGGHFALARRFFTRTLPRAFELLGQAALAVIMTAQNAVVSADAIGRTLWRTLRTGKNLMQWTTAAQGELSPKTVNFFSVLKRSWISSLIGLLLLTFAPPLNIIVKLYGAMFLLYVPMTVLTSRPAPQKEVALTREQREQILSWCAQMFRFYETYAGEDNNWLPPDNVQFSPKEAVARRTSPTNIGMMLVSLLAARDFHFIDSAQLAQRLLCVFDTIDQLDTYKGNLYNWYSTEDLSVLPEPFVSSVDSGNYLCCLVTLGEGLREYALQEPLLFDLIRRIEEIISNTDFAVFYNPTRKLFTIGIDQNGVPVKSYYDFLMSEARASSYFAIATRQIQHKHWRSLRRTMSRSGVYAGPVSWTGTMFEYFMPHLFLPAYEGSLLGEALEFSLYCQKKRAARAGVPWGISESGYFAFDSQLNYQYKAHGIQRLGVKRGLDQECVVSPYSTFLALPFDPQGAFKNLQALEAMGVTGRYGFFEAADFTPARSGVGGCAIVRSFMAHHLGMSMIACANALNDFSMQRRFMREHSMNAAREFLQEKIAKDVVVYDQMKQEPQPRKKPEEAEHLLREAISPATPACTLLSGGELTWVCADTGVNWLRFGDMDVTRRSDDPLMHAQGVFCIARMNGQTLCATSAPFYQQGVKHTCAFADGVVQYSAQNGDMSLYETFQVDRTRGACACTATIRNESGTKAAAQILFYLEPILAVGSEYAAHPAFSKLFVFGERDAVSDTIHFHRKNRDSTNGLFLCAALDGGVQYEYALRREDVTPYPEGMQNLLNFDSQTYDSKTATPDGCLALRVNVVVPARGEQTVRLYLAVSSSKEQNMTTIAAVRAEGLRPAPNPMQSGALHTQIAAQVLPRMFLSAPECEQSRHALAYNTRGQDALWSLGISGDIPIVLYDWALAPDRDCLQAYIALWQQMRLLRLDFDLCVIGAPDLTPPDGVRRVDPAVVDEATMTALRASACYIANTASAAMQPPWYPVRVLHAKPAEIPQAPRRFDVVGGAFIDDVFYANRLTPLPFSHILANESIGTILHDTSLGNTWFKNARECKITPWRNDIATGSDGEAVFLKVGNDTYNLCRGARAQFSPKNAVYSGMAGEIEFRLNVAISAEHAVKELRLELENTGEMEVEAVAAYYLEPVLGVSRLTAKYVQFEQDSSCLVMHNPYNMAMDCYAAVHVKGQYPTYSTNRSAFLSGDWSATALLPNNDPIAGTIVRKRLPPRRREEISFILAAAATKSEAIALAAAPEQIDRQAGLLGGAAQHSLVIETPSQPLNQMVNAFVPHQVFAGRLRGRSGFYQCSGAFGFRDQLQDACALLSLAPNIAREQIIRCCGAQFPQGDVLHWWHKLPKQMSGVRTTFSDDLIWLPLAVCDYVDATGDLSILNETVNFCEGGEIPPGRQEHYAQVHESEEQATVFEHCARALERAHNLGELGLPKIGCGDWCDGFSSVGEKGQGMSVWVAMFLAMTMQQFAPLCRKMADLSRADIFVKQAQALKENVDAHCWDGNWYLRAFYDDKTPIGSRESEECQIDSLPQSFAVFCGMPDEVRVHQALSSAKERLVDREHGIIALFDPPFDKSEKNPGYIKAYPSGIRENGGQYTHAAVWLARALLQAGDSDSGWELLNMINPSARCVDADLAREYKLEPYYIAADIYTHSTCYGHGGWSIYTGAASWFYRTVVDMLLGINLRADRVELTPHLPSDWNGYHALYTVDGRKIDITVRRPLESETGLIVDGEAAAFIPLDGKDHIVVLTI